MESEAALAELMGRIRTMEADYTPDGWPAIQMRDLTALRDALVARSEIGALHLVARIREALGDNGVRMQDELLEYCAELRERPAIPKETPEGWEVFHDPSYYGMWAVRPVGDRSFDSTFLFHFAAEADARVFVALIARAH